MVAGRSSTVKRDVIVMVKCGVTSVWLVLGPIVTNVWELRLSFTVTTSPGAEDTSIAK